MDKGGVTALTLLELSATLDIIGHATLTGRLSDWFRISGKAHICFFLICRKIKDTMSDKVTLSCGVPQGSVLGPMFFTLCATPLYYI